MLLRDVLLLFLFVCLFSWSGFDPLLLSIGFNARFSILIVLFATSLSNLVFGRFIFRGRSSLVANLEATLMIILISVVDWFVESPFLCV